jgi:hypothetical protein
MDVHFQLYVLRPDQLCPSLMVACNPRFPLDGQLPRRQKQAQLQGGWPNHVARHSLDHAEPHHAGTLFVAREGVKK